MPHGFPGVDRGVGGSENAASGPESFPVHSPPASDPTRWRLVRVITLVLLAVWFAVTFVATFFARQLDFIWFGWPFGYWVAAQGALLVYLVLIGSYAWVMGRLDAALGRGAD